MSEHSSTTSLASHRDIKLAEKFFLKAYSKVGNGKGGYTSKPLLDGARFVSDMRREVFENISDGLTKHPSLQAKARAHFIQRDVATGDRILELVEASFRAVREGSVGSMGDRSATSVLSCELEADQILALRDKYFSLFDDGGSNHKSAKADPHAIARELEISRPKEPSNTLLTDFAKTRESSSGRLTRPEKRQSSVVPFTPK